MVFWSIILMYVCININKTIIKTEIMWQGRWNCGKIKKWKVASSSDHCVLELHRDCHWAANLWIKESAKCPLDYLLLFWHVQFFVVCTAASYQTTTEQQNIDLDQTVCLWFLHLQNEHCYYRLQSTGIDPCEACGWDPKVHNTWIITCAYFA